MAASRKRYDPDRVTVESREQRSATWTFPGKHGREPVSGTEHVYAAIDENHGGHYLWEFVVRVPSARGGEVEVRPRTTPNLKVWAELPNRSLIFVPATLGEARGKWYCKVSPADPTGGKTKAVIRWDERDKLPRWFDAFKTRFRKKAKVRPTRGTDGEALVALVPAGDHAAMIRLFFAMKVWVLKERVVFE
jgi:hypothetical protein